MKTRNVKAKLARRRAAVEPGKGNPHMTEHGDGKRVWVRRLDGKHSCYHKPGSLKTS